MIVVGMVLGVCEAAETECDELRRENHELRVSLPPRLETPLQPPASVFGFDKANASVAVRCNRFGDRRASHAWRRPWLCNRLQDGRAYMRARHR
jgi:hypothetical protein